ncbi:FAD-binding oxidoreductase [Maritimibacter sp. 55A14]|uniref:NAD(P)/FAD-dependent oxidoreductase n=1 Tax=Maritimibacter sp. 55A14 TaxID=2174844 RepID=UPI000D60F4D6|nr:FAD-binding oxidoreductase [Maritimibacter sp. 55A14]PWE33176.1 FAD-binding oxidoreductase [Maritimibacter sp. 55A14]
MDSYDVVIAGGAVMGSACAYWLSHMDGFSGRVLVVEPDPGYATASTALSVASIRLQFSNRINVEISRFGLEFIRNASRYLGKEGGVHDLCLRENGYLFLAGSDAQDEILRNNCALQRDLGAETELLDPAALAALFRFLNLSDVTSGSFGPRHEGWFDNMGLLGGLRRAARARGVDYVTDRVTGLQQDGGRITAVELASGRRVAAGALVNAAGTRGAEIARMAGKDIPIEARKRTVFIIDAPNAVHPDAPLLVDHTGFYLRPEGDQWLCATIPQDDPAVDPDDFEPRYQEFEDLIWPRLWARAPGFDAIKILRMWAGHYSYNRLDANAIVGAHPEISNFYFANGFSGHGLQQAPAVGRGIAELICHGEYRSLDLSELGVARILENRPFREIAIV